MQLADLNNRHAGQTIWVCGTGPSLDRAADRIVGPRVYLNRAAFCMPASPGETYWLVLDDAWRLGLAGNWDAHLARVRSGDARTVGLFRSPLLHPRGPRPAPTGANIVTFPTVRADGRAASRDRDAVARDGPALWTGSAMTAVHLAWFMGAAAVALAGIDGSHEYARRVRPHYGGVPARGGHGYGRAKACALDAAAALGLHVDDLTE